MKRRTFLATLAAAAATLTAHRRRVVQVRTIQLDDHALTWSANDSNYGRMSVAS